MALANRSILVADDNEGTRVTLAAALDGAGYSTVLADSAEDALARLREMSQVSAVLADVIMPEVGGIELARQVQSLRPGVPVVLMTGHEECVEEVSAGGAIALLKPFTAATLLRVLEDCVAT